MKRTRLGEYEAVEGNEIQLTEKINEMDDQSNYSKVQELTFEASEKSAPIKISTYQRFKGFIMAFVGGILISMCGAAAKYLKHIPVGEYVFLQFLITLFMVAPLLSFLQPRISFCGKFRWIVLRAVLGGTAGLIKYWSFVTMDFGDAVAIFATTSMFAGIFARILLKEKINIFTVISTVLGMAGIIMIAKPGFIFGGSEKGYSWYPLVTIFGAMCLGAAYTTLRKIGTEVHCLVIPFSIIFTTIFFSAGFFFVRGEELTPPGCFEDRIIMLFASFARVLGLALINRGMAIERTGPVTLVRNLNTVYAYIIQIVLFKKDPEILSWLGAALILVGTLLVTLDKIFPGKFRWCEI